MKKNQIEIRYPKTSQKIKNKIKKINIKYVKSEEKVAYYYENLKTGFIVSFNADITFYAASTIKIIVVLYLYKNNINLNQKIEIKEEDKKQGSGTLKNFVLPKKFTLYDLLKYTIKDSDNTSYVKLVDWIGKEKLMEFGKSLNAKHTLEGKDNFGIISCNDLAIYWKELGKIIEKHPDIADWFINPSYEIIFSKSLYNKTFFKKYGAFDIAFHEAGIVDDEEPYLLIILTQKGKNNKSKQFLNKTAKQLADIHNLLKCNER